MTELPPPRRQLGTQAVLLVGATVVAQLAVAIVYILGARGVTPAEFGLVVATIAIGTAGSGFFDFGSNSLWIREFARSRLDVTQLSRLVRTKLLVAVGIGGILAAGCLMFAPGTSLWTAAPVGVAILLTQTMQVPLRALARMETVALAMVADRAMALAIAFAISGTGRPIADGLWAALAGGSLTSAAICYWMTPRAYRLRFRAGGWSNPWRGSHFYGLSSLAITTQSLDVVILAAAGGPTASGTYGAVSRWVQPLSLLANAYASTSVPFLARAQTLREGWAHARRAAWLIWLAILGCGFLAVGAPILVPLLLGGSYEASITVLQFLALGAVAAILNQPAASFLQSMGFDRRISAIVVATVVVQLAVVALLAGPLGALSAAIAMVVAQWLMSAALAISILRILRNDRKTERSEDDN